jgi:hypothetical protein
VNFFDSSAAAAVTTLKVEPGTSRPALARLRSGAAGSQFASIRPILPKRFSTRFGSNVGDEAITRTFPVRGSSATTAPHRPARASMATCCAVRSRVVTTSFPSIVFPRKSSSALSTSVERSEFAAVR